MRDIDASQINRTAVSATIGELTRIPIPEIPYPHEHRIAPQELTVYRIKGVIDRIVVESDHDWHIVVRDPDEPEVTMIVEIPDPDCVSDVSLKATLAEARRSLHTIPRHGLVELQGVGFFDFIHTQGGAGRNGFELHPVLAVRHVPTP
jgi:hypothetical protein